jgi:hypothetical protein
MGMRMTFSFKGTDGSRRANTGHCIEAIMSKAWETAGNVKIARARTTPKKVRRNSF